MSVEDFKLLREARDFAQFSDLPKPVKEALFRVIDAGPTEPVDKTIIDMARNEYCNVESVAVYDDARLSEVDDGVWVEGWLWIPREWIDAQQPEEPAETVDSEGGHCD